MNHPSPHQVGPQNRQLKSVLVLTGAFYFLHLAKIIPFRSPGMSELVSTVLQNGD